MASNPYDQFDNHPLPGTDAGSSDVPAGIDPLTRRPFQYAGNVPPNDPVGQSTGKSIAEGQTPGAGVLAAGSLATDPEQKRRIIAQQLFPNLPPAEAQSRVFYGTNGRMAAVGSDGQPYYVDPEAPNFSMLRTFSPANLVSNAATLAGPAMPAAGGLAGGLAAGPTSLIIGPLAAGAGAAAGDVARQQLAGRLDPQPELTPYNYRQTAGEAVGAGAGQLAGASLLRIAAPNRLGISSADIRNVRNDPATMAEANRLFNQAQTQGVTLTPGQASRLPSLLSHEDVMASGSAGPGTSDIASTFYGQQRQDLNRAYQQYLDKVSTASDKTDAALQFQQGTEDATRIVRQQGNAAARPYYDAAKGGGQVMSPDLAQLSELPAVKSALKAASEDYHNLTGKAANVDAPDFELWNLAKTKLDDAWTAAKRDGQNTTAMALDNIRQRFLTNLDAAYPDYATARATTAPFQRQAARMESTVGGATGDGTESARSIVNKVFSPNANNPRAIAENRDSFIAAGRGEEWNAGVRSYLQEAFDNAVHSQEGLNPAMLRRQIWSNPNAKEVMQAAMSPQQFQGFNNIMETIEAVARSRGMNSLTTPRAAGAAALEDAAGSTAGVRLVRGVTSAASPRLASTVANAGDKIAGAMTQRNMTKMAERLFSPDGLALLGQAAMMTPGSRFLASAAAELLGQQAGGSDIVTGRAPTPGTNLRPPPLLGALNPNAMIAP